MSRQHPNPVRGVVFDLDGTLTVPVLDFAAMRAEIGIAGGDILRSLAKMSEDERTRALGIIGRHEEAAAAESELSDGARELLDFIAGAGIKTGVVTRNSRSSVDTFCRKHGVAFDAVITRDDAPPKPSPEPLAAAVEQMGLGKDEVIYVGDFELDRLTGEAAGITTYVVRNHAKVRDDGPAEMRIGTLRDVIAIIEEARSGYQELGVVAGKPGQPTSGSSGFPTREARERGRKTGTGTSEAALSPAKGSGDVPVTAFRPQDGDLLRGGRPVMRRQTKRDLSAIFKERGLRANKLLGQNFLVDHNVLDFICHAGRLSAADVVLEIGAGTGLLTQHIAGTGARVVAVEIDSNLFGMLSDYVGDLPNVRLVNSDIHGKRRRLSPAVVSALDEALASGGTLKVISNLPYCISSDLLVSLLEMDRPAELMIVTVQKEFAVRMLAKPGSREYGIVTVLLSAQSEVKRLRDLAPSVFWPVPKVGSSVVRITPDPERLALVSDYGIFKAVVSALFGQRRKTAAGALRSMTRPKVSKADITGVFDAVGIAENARADGLSVEQIIALANRLGEQRSGGGE